MKAADIFTPGQKVIMSIRDANISVRFHPSVLGIDEGRLALNLPDDWWQQADLKPGLGVNISAVQHETIFNLEGEIQEVFRHRGPNLIVALESQPERSQRRTFYRLDYQADLNIVRAVLPDGRRAGPLPASLLDISAGGVGLKTRCQLPPETLLETERLFEALVPLRNPEDYLLEVRWCRPDRGEGFRLGAAFQFEDPSECDRVARFVHHLQVVRLAKYCHIVQSTEGK